MVATTIGGDPLDATGLSRWSFTLIGILGLGYLAGSNEREPPTGQARGISRVARTQSR